MSYAVAVTTEPAKEPVSLTAAKMHLRVPTDNEDPNIGNVYIPAARRRVEAETNRQLITATCTLSLDSFPSQPCPIYLPRPPVQSVTSIKYINTSGDLTILDAANYVVDTKSEPARIHPAWGSTWPAVQRRTAESTVIVEYQAGYGDDEEDVPAGLREAMLLLISHYYYSREDVVIGTIATQLPRAVTDLLASYSFGDEFTDYRGKV